MDTIKIFENDDFGAIRTAVDGENYYFCLNDVCKAIELNNPSRVKPRLRPDGLTTSKVIDSLGREQEMIFVNEPNLYRTIFMSRKPSAEKFVDWVTSEVLPSIRKHGGYIDGQEHMSIDEINEKYMQVLASITKEKEALAEKVEALSEAYEQEKARREELKEDLRIYRNAEHNMTLGEFAALLRANGRKETRSKFFENLRKSGFLYSDDDRWNYPKEEFMNDDYPIFTVRECEYNGEYCVQPLLTPDGQNFFIWLLLEKKKENG